MADSIWPTVRAEREALARDLRSISEEQWSTPSLCEGWTVRDVLAHMTATAKITTQHALIYRHLIDRFGVDQVASASDPGRNMEGKEVRFGPAASGLWAATTTGTSFSVRSQTERVQRKQRTIQGGSFHPSSFCLHPSISGAVP